MLSHFHTSSRSRRPSSPPPLATPQPEGDLLAPVLAHLVGRTVSIVADGRIYTGRLLRPSPIMLVGPEGQVALINGPAISVAF